MGGKRYSRVCTTAIVLSVLISVFAGCAAAPGTNGAAAGAVIRPHAEAVTVLPDGQPPAFEFTPSKTDPDYFAVYAEADESYFDDRLALLRAASGYTEREYLRWSEAFPDYRFSVDENGVMTYLATVFDNTGDETQTRGEYYLFQTNGGEPRRISPPLAYYLHNGEEVTEGRSIIGYTLNDPEVYYFFTRGVDGGILLSTYRHDFTPVAVDVPCNGSSGFFSYVRYYDGLLFCINEDGRLVIYSEEGRMQRAHVIMDPIYGMELTPDGILYLAVTKQRLGTAALLMMDLNNGGEIIDEIKTEDRGMGVLAYNPVSNGLYMAADNQILLFDPQKKAFRVELRLGIDTLFSLWEYSYMYYLQAGFSCGADGKLYIGTYGVDYKYLSIAQFNPAEEEQP